MTEFEWRLEDVRDLVRRSRFQTLEYYSPFSVATAVLAVWFAMVDAPGSAAVLGGMCIAWTASLLWSIRQVGRRWRVYIQTQSRPLRVDLGDEGVTWQAKHGTRCLLWDALSAKRVGRTWALLVGGHEVAYLPARVLSPVDVERLEARARQT